MCGRERHQSRLDRWLLPSQNDSVSYRHCNSRAAIFAEIVGPFYIPGFVRVCRYCSCMLLSFSSFAGACYGALLSLRI